MAFKSLEEICAVCKAENIHFAQAVVCCHCKENGCSQDAAFGTMGGMWHAMLEALSSYDATERSASGLSGGDGRLFEEYAQKGQTCCGELSAQMIAAAIKMAESNACMKRIVASPTAGSCGVLPAVLIPLFYREHIQEEKIIQALFVAAGIGQVVAERATISGAEGGCQAEVGTASAMAAGALVFLRGGNEMQICDAAGFALQNVMGLVCDPVAGLVEVPCIKRNVIGVMNALSAADMALAKLSAHIPADQIIDAMEAVGRMLSPDLRETGNGGLALTPAGKSITQKLNQNV